MWSPCFKEIFIMCSLYSILFQKYLHKIAVESIATFIQPQVRGIFFLIFRKNFEIYNHKNYMTKKNIYYITYFKLIII